MDTTCLFDLYGKAVRGELPSPLLPLWQATSGLLVEHDTVIGYLCTLVFLRKETVYLATQRNTILLSMCSMALFYLVLAKAEMRKRCLQEDTGVHISKEWFQYQTPRKLTKTWNDPFTWEKQAQQEGKRFKVFCASLADVFEPHPDVVKARHRLWETIEQTPHLDWQLLTKRPKFIQRLVPQTWLHSWPKHVWIGTSVGTQQAAEKRIDYVLDVPAPVIFLSCEPLVELVMLSTWLAQGKISWVICGGYSGSQHRPMDLAWARSLREECHTYGVAFYMKQLGTVYARQHRLHDWKGEAMEEFPEDLKVRVFPSSPVEDEPFVTQQKGGDKE